MSETKTPRTTKEKWALLAKLVVGLGALTGAVERYIDLAEQNEMVYAALVSKVNKMSEEMASVKGQNELILMMISGRPTMAPTPVMEAEPEPDELMGEEEAGEEGAEEAAGEEFISSPPETETFAGETAVEMAAEEPAPPKVKKKTAQIQAYEQLPANLEQLEADYEK